MESILKDEWRSSCGGRWLAGSFVELLRLRFAVVLHNFGINLKNS